MVAKLKSSWEESIRPTLTDMEGDAWFLSTPKGLNYFYDLFQRGQTPEMFPAMEKLATPLRPSIRFCRQRKLMRRALSCRRWYSGKNTWQSFSGDGAVFRNG